MPNKFTLDTEKAKENSEFIYYTIFGKHSKLDENNNPLTDNEDISFAKKKITQDNRERYFIKVGVYGKIYNPMGLYTEGTANKFLTKAGKKAWNFKEVNAKAFEMYINFLRTKNVAWLNNAERSM